MAIGDVQRLRGSALIQNILSSQKDIDAQLDSTSTVDFLLRRNDKPTPLNRLSQGIQHREDVQQLQTIQIDNRTAQINEFISDAPELEAEIRKLDESGSKMREIDDMIRKSREQQVEPETKTAQQLNRAPIGFALEALGRGVVNTGRFFSSNLVRGIGSQVMNSIVNSPTSVQSAEERERSGTALSQIFFDAADAIDSKLDDIEQFIGKKPEDLNIKELSDIIDPKKIISLVLESGPTTAALVATTLLTGGAATLPIIFTSVTGSETKELMERDDLSLPQKLATATSIAAVEGILETVGLGAITKASKQGLIRNVIRMARGESGTEAAQEAQAILQKEGIDPFKAEETWAQIAAAGVVGAVSGVTIGTAIEAAQQGQPIAEGKPAPVTETEVDPDIISVTNSLVEQGAQTQRERNPEQFIRGDRLQPVTVPEPQAELAPEIVQEVTERTKGAPKDERVKIPTEDTEVLYDEAEKRTSLDALKSYLFVDFGTDTNLSIFDKAVGGTDSDLGAINVTYKVNIINMEVIQRRIKKQWSQATEPFINLLIDVKKKMGRGMRFRLDLALANGNIEQVKKVLIQYDKKFNPKVDPVKAFEDLQLTLETVREMALNAGIEVGNVENFFPRVVKNLGALTKLIRGTKFRGVYSEMLNKATREKGRTLTQVEQLEIIDRAIGYKGKFSTSSTLKPRQITVLNNKLLAQYFNAEQALDIYFQRLSSAIAQQQFFKSLGIEPEVKNLSSEPSNTDPQNVSNELLKDGLEGNIIKLINQDLASGKLKPEDENDLNFLLSARFNIKPLAKPLRYAKTFSTGMLLARGLSSPIKQMADLGRAVADSGFYSTGKSVIKAAVRKSKLTLNDLDIEDISAAMIDISTSGKIVDRMLRVNLFRTFDSIGKEVLVNAKIDSLGRRARKDKLTEHEKRIINDIFDATPEIKAQLMEDLKNGILSQDIKLLGFHLLARTQPISLSQLPPWYFTSGNGRVFFTLKTFQARRLDDIRETAIRDMMGKDRTTKQRKEGLKRLVVLMGFLTMGELATDELIRWLRGQQSAQDFPDKIWEALFKVIGTNKYALNNVERKGFWTAVQEEFLSVPTGEADKFLNDAWALFTDQDYGADGVASLRNVPWVGESLYFWYGAGKIKNVKNYVRSVREELKERRLTQKERFAVRAVLLRYHQNNPETLKTDAYNKLIKDLNKNAINFDLPESTTQKFWEQFLNEIKPITALPETIMK